MFETFFVMLFTVTFPRRFRGVLGGEAPPRRGYITDILGVYSDILGVYPPLSYPRKGGIMVRERGMPERSNKNSLGGRVAWGP